MPQCCYLAKGAKRPSHTTNTIKFDRIPFDPCNSIKRFDLCLFDQKNSTYLHPPLARNNPHSLRLEFALMSVKNFRTFVIHSRNQILGNFDVDKLCPIFLSSIERTFLFIRQTQPLLKRFCKRNIFESFRENRREKVTRTKS